MTIEELLYFTEVYKSGSITDAAASLHITAQGVSQAIKRFEKDLGYLLFIRDRNGTIPTENAKLLYPHAMRIIDSIHLFKSEAQRCQSNEERKLTLLFSDKNIWTKKMIEKTELYAEQTGLECVILQDTPKNLLEFMKQYQVDLVFTLEYAEENTLQYYHMFTLPFVVVMDRSNPLASHSELTWNDLRKQTFVLETEGKRFVNSVMKHVRDAGYEPIVDRFTDGFIIAVEFISGTSDHIVFVHEQQQQMTLKLYPRLVTIPISPPPEVNIGFSRLKDYPMKTCMKTYMKAMRGMTQAVREEILAESRI